MEVIKVNFLKKLIPDSVFNDFCIVTVSVDDVKNEESAFSATIRLKIRSKLEFDAWLQEHERLSQYTYRVQTTKPRLGKYVGCLFCSCDLDSNPYLLVLVFYSTLGP